MNEPLNIVIVGGGTAGWMSAAAFAGVVPESLARVHLIESEDIGTVGVGEATLPHMKDFNDYIGIIEADMMQQTNATFKTAIEFVDWGYKGARYQHPFGTFGTPMAGVGFHHQWVRATLGGHESALEDYSYPIVAGRKGRFEFPGEDKAEVDASYSYAYHFDASLYAKFLRKFAQRRGVMRTEGKIVDVRLDGQSGNIAAVKMKSGEEITGDLFIDCSGFRGLLIGEALDAPYEEWTKWLPCDRAVAVPCERAEGELLPYTRATARDAGWQWRIPLQHRTGNGYVYASEFISDDEAAASLMDNLDGAALDDPKLLRFKAGRRKQSWVKNCVSIGLSSGFLEPLESTSIYLIQIGILNLLKLLPRKTIDPALPVEFNRMVDAEYDRVRDFLILHYHANIRDDAELWRYVRDMEVPDSLTERIELFRRRGHIENYRHGLFAPPSWLAVYVGQGLRPMAYDPLADRMEFDTMVAELDGLRAMIASRVEAMPSHDEFIRDYCPSMMAPAPAGAAGGV